MAVRDLWLDRKGERTKLHGKGSRYRVSVVGYPATSHRTKAEAEAVNSQRLLSGPPGAPSTLTVGECIELWLESKNRLRRASREAANLAARAVRPRWGDLLVTAVERGEVQRWLNRQHGSASRVRKLAQCLGGAMRIGVQMKAITESPCDGLVLPEEAHREPYELSLEQVEAIASNAHAWGKGRALEHRQDAWYAPLVWFLATTAARVGEAVALDVGHVVKRRVKGQDVWRVRVGYAKGGRPRDLPLSPEVVAMLDLKRAAAQPLFTTPLGGRVDVDHFRARSWASALESAGLAGKGIRIHDLRHTAITWAISDGATIKAVQEMAGHKSGKTTLDVYSHLMEGGIDTVSAGMSARLNRTETVLPSPG